MKTQTELPTLPAWGEKRLIKLIEFLEKLPRRKFDFSKVVAKGKQNGHYCGTVCCAAGWLPAIFPRLVKWTPPDENLKAYIALRKQGVQTFSEVTESVFGMNYETAEYLFLPDKQRYVDSRLTSLPDTATPKQVARMLRAYLKLTHTPRKP